MPGAYECIVLLFTVSLADDASRRHYSRIAIGIVISSHSPFQMCLVLAFDIQLCHAH